MPSHLRLGAKPFPLGVGDEVEIGPSGGRPADAHVGAHLPSSHHVLVATVGGDVGDESLERVCCAPAPAPPPSASSRLNPRLVARGDCFALARGRTSCARPINGWRGRGANTAHTRSGQGCFHAASLTVPYLQAPHFCCDLNAIGFFFQIRLSLLSLERLASCDGHDTCRSIR